ncbi:MAG: DUF499 domain-containing protein [Thermomicrobiales bacterium]
MPTNPTNHSQVGDGLKIVQAALAPFIARELRACFKDEWWTQVYYNVPPATQAKLPKQGDVEDLAEQVDSAGLLQILDKLWHEAFKATLGPLTLTHTKELRTHRNTWAHHAAGDFDGEDAYRALDTMTRFLEAFDKPASKQTRALAQAVQRAMLDAQPKVAVATPTPTPTPAPAPKPKQASLGLHLRPWRDAVKPHTDVASGRYQTAQFAADLADVLAGKADADYQDPVQFFARTYLTEGMRRLLASALRRIAGSGGDPVIQLKTAFGGGKTHTMLALFHLLKAGQAGAILPGIDLVVTEAEVDPAKMPTANVAVLVGTDLESTRERLDAAGNGVVVRTLWGEMAAQLGGAAAYEVVRSSDEAGVAPGTNTLVELLTRFGPAVVLIDEFVAYARNIYTKTDLPAGTFDSNLTFIQALTEAAKRSRNGLLIASIPESAKELGGEAGVEAQQRLEQIFGRVEAVWKPVAAREGFEIVRRRLFGEIADLDARDLTCRQFHKLYNDSSGDFPKEAGEVSYLERLKSAYPIHPEVFDRLYDDWATLEEFQRTRGVLRLMAGVIHALWRDGDQAPMILPGSLPMDDRAVRDELLRYLPDTWNSVVDKDVEAEPRTIDAGQMRFGQIGAGRRLARAIFLGSAPHVAQQRTRGIEAPRIRLGVAQPGESVPTYNDALHQLSDRLTYLYSGDQRYWYDTRPNLNRTADERATTIESFRVLEEIKRRLDAQRGRADFAAVHRLVESGDVPDTAEARLVILRPEATHRNKQMDSPAIKKAAEILESRGGSPRIHKNMLIFIAADEAGAQALERITRRYLAWDSIVKDADTLNLDRHGEGQAKQQRDKDDRAVDGAVNEAFSWLIVPQQSTASAWSWEATRISGGSPVVERAAAKLRTTEQLIPRWSAHGLTIELERWFWPNVDHVETRKLWDALANYAYLPRLTSEQVLLEAISGGLPAPDFFGYAQGIDSSGRYQGLIFNRATAASALRIDSYSLLVKPDAARRQIEADEARERRRIAEEHAQTDAGDVTGGYVVEPPVTATGATTVPSPSTTPPPIPKLRRYYGSVKLDEKRINRDAGQIADEVIQHLANLPHAEVTVTIEVEATLPDGVPDDIVRTIVENANTLKFTRSSFEEE